jgi:lipid-A-disaccharide synthase-like uncharacterized protein
MRAARVLLAAVVLAAAATTPAVALDERSTTIPLRWDGYRASAVLQQTQEGPRFEVTTDDGRVERLDPDAFAAALLARAESRPFVYDLLNVASPVGVAWVLFGLFAQVLFAGRMVVQWIMSERLGRSVVPPVFWWLSLAGSAMLLAYFLWRHDIVGILGQSLGFVIYVRNLMLLRAARLDARVANDGARLTSA